MASSRHPVANGGLFGASEKAGYSKNTHDLLKVMMEESKLTNFQRRKLQESMKEGESLPTRVNPTSSDRKKCQEPQLKPTRLSRGSMISSNMRTLEKIEMTGAFEREKYVPKPVRSLEKEKERLSNLMAFGEELEKLPKKKVEPKTNPAPPKDRFEEIQEEIVERKEFLSEMERMGQGSKYQSMISTQISQLIREMEVIDQQRIAVLEEAMGQQETENGNES